MPNIVLDRDSEKQYVLCRLQYVGSSMTLGNKLRSLRSVEGSLRGLGRPMTQQELAKAMKKEVGRGLSQAYLSQIESGTRPHLTHGTRTLRARFSLADPGPRVADPTAHRPD